MDARYAGLRARGAALLVLLGTTALMSGEKPRQPKVEKIVDGDPLIRLLPPDEIPAIDKPDMIPASEADDLMKDDAPVLGVFDGRWARAYPTRFLDRHEIVNDRVGDLPIAATW